MHHSIRLNETPTWCNKMQILLLQTFSTCFGCHAPIIRSVEYWHGSHWYRWYRYSHIRDEAYSFVPNMAKWGSTCNHNYMYRWLPCQYSTLLMMGAWRPKHVEKVCSNKICILLHYISVSFNLLAISYFVTAVVLDCCEVLNLWTWQCSCCTMRG